MSDEIDAKGYIDNDSAEVEGGFCHLDIKRPLKDKRQSVTAVIENIYCFKN